MSKLPGLFERISTAARRKLSQQGTTPENLRYSRVSHDPTVPLPPGAEAALRIDHPTLLDLRRRYAAYGPPATEHTFWSEDSVRRDLQLPWFRGDNAFVWQYRQLGHSAAEKIAAIARYVESRDGLGLLGNLSEDGLFGCWTFPDPRLGQVSRDLLDSVNEVNFLERSVGLSRQSELRVLDIGAGYGRLAHRICSALDNVERYSCVDAIAESTFVCDYYIRFRRIQARAQSVPLDQLDAALHQHHDLALNIHSFSECSFQTVGWWLQRLRSAQVGKLLIVPNHWDELRSSEADGTVRDYSPLLDQAGYRLVHKEPIYDDARLRDFVGIKDFFLLYELQP